MTKDIITIQQSQDVLDNAELLYSTDDVEQAINSMAKAITEQLHQNNPLILPVMIGGIVLAEKLIAQFHFSLQIDYIHATRYRAMTSANELSWLKKTAKSLKNKTILLIDDILDKGISLAAIIKYCYEAGAEKVLTAVLAEKNLEQDKPIKHADFTGLTMPDRYVFGYGMDYHEYHRNVAGIYALID